MLRCTLALLALFAASISAEDTPTPAFEFVRRLAEKNPDALKRLAQSTGELKDLQRAACARLSVTVDFYQPNSGGADAEYFSNAQRNAHVLPWKTILLVNPLPGQPCASNHLVQIRAVVRGLKPLIEAKDSVADTFPVRLYRTFVNELDDDESAYETAHNVLYGKVERDITGCVREPEGITIELTRVAMDGDDAIFASSPIDVEKNSALNPARNAIPPSFAACDCDAYRTQFHEKEGDEECDAWAFAEAMKRRGFVSAGMAYPTARKFGPEGKQYQFALALSDVLEIEEKSIANLSPESRAKLRTAPEAFRVGKHKGKLRLLGASEVLGRPVINGSFIVSTGVQKLVVSALTRADNGDISWRFPGIVRATDGWMDQCLIRAPAHVFFFSGHGWDKDSGGQRFTLMNCYTFDNPSVFKNPESLVYMTAELPAAGWQLGDRSLDENMIELADKWKKDELNLQYLFIVGCHSLRCRRNDPLKRWETNSGTLGWLCFEKLNVKGVFSFAEHGFTSASFMKRMFDPASQKSAMEAWLSVWRDDAARQYTWYETNEHYGQSRQKTYDNALHEIVPACMIRTAHANDVLSPTAVARPCGAAEVIFVQGYEDEVRKVTGKLKN